MNIKAISKEVGRFFSAALGRTLERVYCQYCGEDLTSKGGMVD